jgi:hypothetical protein
VVTLKKEGNMKGKMIRNIIFLAILTVPYSCFAWKYTFYNKTDHDVKVTVKERTGGRRSKCQGALVSKTVRSGKKVILKTDCCITQYKAEGKLGSSWYDFGFCHGTATIEQKYDPYTKKTSYSITWSNIKEERE